VSESRRPCSKCGKRRAERFFLSHRGRVCQTCRRRRTSGTSRAVRLLQTYGITADDHRQMLAGQDGQCAICGRAPRYNLDVDHCHKTGLVRGLLCKLCNRRLLPAAGDSTRILLAAISYLQHPPAPLALGRDVFVPERAA
jgi:hypothetical protein